MKQTDLLELKFNKEYSEEKDWYYYYYNLTNDITLISPASDEVVNDNWFVCIMESSPVVEFNNLKELKEIINLIEKNKRK